MHATAVGGLIAEDFLIREVILRGRHMADGFRISISLILVAISSASLLAEGSYKDNKRKSR